MRSAIVLVGAGLVMVAVVMACGDDDDVGGTPPKQGTQQGTSSSSGAPADAGTPYTLDDVCDRTAPIICDLRKTCCAADYNEAGCLSHQKAQCAKDVAAARAGTETFHPERIDPCIPKLREVLSQCAFTWELLQKYGSEIGACAAFDGKKAVGDACEQTSECVPGPKATDLASCDDKTKQCKIISFLGETEACSLGNGVSAACATGLYCNVDFTQAGLNGFCKKATTLGMPCDKDKKPFNLECGLGNYCDTTTAKCVVGKPAGAACTGPNLECQSLECSMGDAGVCNPLNPLTKPEECKGP